MKQGLTIASLVGAAALAHNVMGLGEEDRRRSAAPPADNARPVVHAHEEPAHDPWMPRRATAPEGAIEHCGPWVRDAYASIQVNVDHRGCNIAGDAANEPSIAIDPTEPRKMVIGWRQFDTVESNFRQAGYGYSHDAGHTWIFRSVLEPGVFGSDPVLAADAQGNIFYHTIRCAQLFRCGYLFRTEDGGVSWQGPFPTFAGDKPWLAIDRTDGIGGGNVYLVSQLLIARSIDGGATFEFPVPLGPSLLTWGSMWVGLGGEVYIADYDGIIARSDNVQEPGQVPVFEAYATGLGGGYWGPSPNPGGLGGQPWVATGYTAEPPYTFVYVLASVGSPTDQLLDVMFAHSTDGGVTWSDPVRVNDDPEGNGAWQWFGTMSVAPNGRIDAVWNDTRNYLDAPEANLSELFYAYSEDAGVTWSANIPVSRVFDSHVGWPQQHKIGDYYHMISDNLGVNVAYAATFNGEQDIYFLRIGPWDCNGNEIPDKEDIALESSYDCNANDVPDECEYRGDFDGDRVTTLTDFAAFQRCYTGDSAPVSSACCRLFDLDGDDSITLADLMALHRVLTGP